MVAYRGRVAGRYPTSLAFWRTYPRAADAVLAIVLAALAVAGQVLAAGTQSEPLGRRVASIGLCLLCSLPVALRRSFPLPVLVMTVTAVTVQVSLHHWSSFLAVGSLVAIYTVAAYRPFAEAVTALVFSLALVGVCLAVIAGPVDASGWVSSTVTLAGATVVGRNVQMRRARLLALEDRARQAERDREREVREAVSAERQRIARELHDVVAHNISVLGVLADGGRRMLGRDPVAVDDTLATMAATSRQTLREMRHLLDVLRVDDEPESAPDAPQPGTALLPALVEQVTEAGLPVELTVTGQVRELSSGVDLSAYRIAQEALTNALKHAGPASATVRLVYGSRALVLTIADNGRGPGTDRVGGHGLLGMRERVALYGGSLEVGPRTGGGFLVRAELPRDGDLAEDPSLPERRSASGPAPAPLPVAGYPGTPTSARPAGWPVRLSG